MSLKRNQRIVLSDNLLYHGNTKDAVPHGRGQVITPYSSFDGRWKNGSMEGKGTLNIMLNNMFFIGGDSGSDEKNPFPSFFYVSKDWKIHALPPCLHARSVGTLMFKDHYFYYIGGFNGNRSVPYVERFDIMDGTWENLSPLINRRASFSSFVYESEIYVCGGIMGSVAHKSIETYDSKQNKWIAFGSMAYSRIGLITQIWNHKCYIIGGKNEQGTWLPLEVYDLKTKKSTIYANIIQPYLSSASILVLVNHKPCIFVAGGCTKEGSHLTVTDKVFLYSIEDNTLDQISSLNVKRNYPSLVMFDNELYCMGGHDEKLNAHLPFEKYNFLNDKWEIQEIIPVSMSGTSFLSVENYNITVNGTWKCSKLHGKSVIQMNEKKMEGKYVKGVKQGFFNKVYYVNNIPASYQDILWENKVKKIKNIPDQFKCPISLEIMSNPVIIESGITFEKKNIEEWFLHHGTCPITRRLVHNKLIPNIILKTMIQDFTEKKCK
tara:strand:+ start:555 stop:2027 length:1473 start_codon:yes stop_codon:yes gene_type:complete